MFFAGKVYDRGLELYSNSENWVYNSAVTICLSFNMHQPINLIFGNLFFLTCIQMMFGEKWVPVV